MGGLLSVALALVMAWNGLALGNVLGLPSNDLGGLTFALAQASVGDIFGGTNTKTKSLGSAPVTGDLVVVCQGSDGGSTISSVTSTGATWAKAAGAAGGEIWYSTNVTTAAITVNLSAADSGGFTILHFTGNLVASPLDVNGAAGGFTGSAAPGSRTPTADNYLAVACVGAAGATITATPASYTAQAAQADGAVNERCAYWIQTMAAATNPTWTLSGVTTWEAVVAVFKHG